MKFHPLDVSYKIVDGKPIVELFGKTENGKAIVQVEGFAPYFWVIGKEPKHEKIVSVEKKKKKLLGKDVDAYKTSVSIPGDVPEIREKFASYEADILYGRRFLIDNEIIPLDEYEITGEEIDFGYTVPTIRATNIQKKSETPPELKILGFDIETHTNFGGDVQIGGDPIIMIGMYGAKFKKVLTWKGIKNNHDYVEVLEDEKAMLTRMGELINEYSPDIITGYFSDNFDLPYVKKRAEALKVSLKIGIDGSEINTGRGKFAEASINGIVHLDMYRFVSRVYRYQYESFKLDYVAEKLLGRKKVEVDLSELFNAWNNTNEKKLRLFLEYNLVDAQLVYDLCELMLPQVVEFTKLIGVPPAAVSRMSFSQLVEWYLIKEAPKFNEIAPNRPTFQEERDRRSHSYEGAFVFEPTPGLYHDIAVFDFRSLYPTIISAHNVSPDTLVRGADSSDGVLKGLSFDTKKKGFISSVINDIIHYRLEVKKQAKEHPKDPMLKGRDSALKTILNSIYGYYGFFAAKWYSLECAEAITAYGRHHITDVIEKAEESGLKVLYSDTDSVFIALQGKSESDVNSFVKNINKHLPGIMELEYEDTFASGVFVAAKGSDTGAKKRYAMMRADGSMKIRGFETVRRNLSLAAKETQEKVLRMVLEGKSKEEIEKYIKGVVKKLRERTMPLDKVIITTSLSRDIKAYANQPPHVKVALEMKKKGVKVGTGTTIKYVVTSGSKLVRDRAKLPEDVKEGEYDAEYYIENQVMPAVEKILSVLDLEAADLSSKQKQNKLDGYFS